MSKIFQIHQYGLRLKICPIHAQEMPCIYPVYAQNISKKVMPKICPNNAPDMINTIPRYAQGMLEIHQDMTKICLKYKQ